MPCIRVGQFLEADHLDPGRFDDRFLLCQYFCKVPDALLRWLPTICLLRHFDTCSCASISAGRIWKVSFIDMDNGLVVCRSV